MKEVRQVSGTGEHDNAEPVLPELDPTTLAVQQLVNASRELTNRTARKMNVHPTDMSALALLEQFGPMGAAGDVRGTGGRVSVRRGPNVGQPRNSARTRAVSAGASATIPCEASIPCSRRCGCTGNARARSA
ncbi:hypothetical protein [Lentzea sp. NPDC060358]|uniref:hypothetical protein n=1 Tax=Lentzea sp. NPDC060358 TaxID=3347103 RepID=UPI00365AB61E